MNVTRGGTVHVWQRMKGSSMDLQGTLDIAQSIPYFMSTQSDLS